MKTCPNCGSEFVPRHGSQKFCSAKCKWSFNNKNRTLKPNFSAACKVCGKSFDRYVEPSKIKAGLATVEYCSLKCKGKALRRENHPMWKGGRILEADGYVMVFRPDHPHANNKGYVFEHRLVMEAHLGRLLKPEEVVHHRNEVRCDNRIKNLELYSSNAEHKRDDYAGRRIDRLGRFLPKEQ